MVGYKITKKDKKLLFKLMDEFNEVAKTAKEFCKIRELTYTESSRKRASKFLHAKGYFKNRESLPKTVNKKDCKVDAAYHEVKGKELPRSKYYLITWAQNGTPVHDELLRNMEAYKEFLGAEMCVILGRYKNPTSVFTDNRYETWDNKVRLYWDVNRHDIHKFVTILGDVKIQPTAVNPLVGLESITGETTTVVGHPKMHLKPVPVLEGHPKKILVSTGSITVPNYTDSKGGKKAESHHIMGFTIIEIKDEETFFIRQVEATNEGSFIDLYYEVENGEVKDLDRAEAIVWGDTHIGSLNPEILTPTENLIEDLNIHTEIHHDLVDGASVNNHIINNPIEQYKRWQENKEFVEVELKRAILFLRRRPETFKIIVQSNHNDRFDRWILNQDWKKDMANAKAYLKYTLATLEGKADKGIVSYVLEEAFDESELVCLDYDDSKIINTHEIAHHGHIGSNGSKGSIEQFRKMSTNIILGHYHKPMRLDKVIAVGTSTKLREGYNKGASDWLNSHAIIHKNNKVQHIIFIRGEFTTFEREVL